MCHEAPTSAMWVAAMRLALDERRTVASAMGELQKEREAACACNVGRPIFRRRRPSDPVLAGDDWPRPKPRPPAAS